ncbi:hypothetical protein BU23DRAFT_572345 [Bimuria novae-zelandiae CBS 107.79]|uniref:Uncharacterized protein n=1 Tax=Bimuria novae-zelandiae CBS 107.79 TaxID=1447943 RepID=A0A6A5UTD0_9PLEO|nr:hypothetical protein BU23DRAFT_572345 [Bimuria novae-zelandiae CBS 107.79]
MSHPETIAASSPRESSINIIKRKASGVVGSGVSQRRVKAKKFTNADVIRVLCPFFVKTRKRKAKSCWCTGFNEIAKMRDHLKDVHNLSKTQLDTELNFKGSRFRSLKTLGEKWKFTFTILFPDVPKDKIPCPYEDKYHEADKALHPPGNCPILLSKTAETNCIAVDLTLLAPTLQNWLHDRLSTDPNVPIWIKRNIITDFGEAFEEIVAHFAVQDEKDTALLDWGHLAKHAPTPEFELPDDHSSGLPLDEPILECGKVDLELPNDHPAGSPLNHPVLEYEKVDLEPNVEVPTFNGLPKTPAVGTLSLNDPAHNYRSSTSLQLPPTSLNSPLDEKYTCCSAYQATYEAAPQVYVPYTSTDAKEVRDFGRQVLALPVIPPTPDSPLDAKPVLRDDGNTATPQLPTDSMPEVPPSEELHPVITTNGFPLGNFDLNSCAGSSEDWTLFDTPFNFDSLPPF